MRMEAWHWKKSHPLAETYIHQFPRVDSLYEYDYRKESSWAERAEWLDRTRGSRVDRNRLADVLAQYNRSIGASPAALANVDKLRDDRALVVVGGQQAGLFAGPALTVWKAITIVQTAARAAERLGRPVVPVFWIAGEDHDWEEVNHFHYLAEDLSVRKYRLPDVPLAGRAPVSRVELTEQAWQAALDALSAALPDTEHKPGLLERLHSLAHSSRTLTEQFARIFAWLFADSGLVLVDAADPALRRLESPMFRRIIEERRPLGAAMIEARDAVGAMGFVPQADVSDEQLHLFVLERGQRHPLIERDGAIEDRKTGKRWTERELADVAEREPERLSNDALTRPIMQDYVFPVLATVLGPAEIAYWGLLRQAFARLDMKMPILWPRQEYTLIDPTSGKAMERLGLTFSEVANGLENRRERFLAGMERHPLSDRFDDVRRRFLEVYQPLADAVAEQQPELAKIAETNVRKLLEQIDFLRRRAEDAYVKRQESPLRQLDTVAAKLLPMGKPQERVYSVFGYLNLHGFAWLAELKRKPPEDASMHQLIHL